MNDSFFALALEILFAGIVIIIAGVSDNTGKAVDFFLFGLMLVFLFVAHPEIVKRFSDAVTNIQIQGLGGQHPAGKVKQA